MHMNNLCINFVSGTFATGRTTDQRLHIGHIDLRQRCSRYLWTVVTINDQVGKIMKKKHNVLADKILTVHKQKQSHSEVVLHLLTSVYDQCLTMASDIL